MAGYSNAAGETSIRVAKYFISIRQIISAGIDSALYIDIIY